MLPEFLIVGAMKSGTSTLRDYLRRHEDVFIPPGEVHFFNRDDRYLDEGLDWYRRQFEEARADQVVGEKTPTYSYQANVAERIYEHLPDVKLVWLFREPVARAYSNYWHAVIQGAEPLSFEQVTRREDEIIADNIWRGYLSRSRYAEQVERFLEYFELSQMHFILFEEMIADPKTALEELCTFLEVDTPQTLGDRAIRSNVRKKLPRSIKLEHGARSLFGHGSTLYGLVKTLNRKKVDSYPKLDPSYRAELLEKFEPHNRRLSELVGLELSAWS